MEFGHLVGDGVGYRESGMSLGYGFLGGMPILEQRKKWTGVVEELVLVHNAVHLA